VAKKELLSSKNSRASSKPFSSKMEREKRILNCIANTTIILMSTMMGAFNQVMIDATGAMASGIAGALGGKEAEEKVEKNFKQGMPEVDEKMKMLISDMRKDVHAQLEQRSKEIMPLLSDSAFDVGPKIVEKYNFKLPKLTQELDEIAIAGYIQLLVSEDPSFAEMFKELVS
jgi:hypothetical protein